jgi:glycosyltransferase involved in cell wall biosynthesis
MRSDGDDVADIICLFNWHGVGGAQLNAGLLTVEFGLRGYRSKLGFLFEREPDADLGTESYFVVAPRAPKSPSDWRQFGAGCFQQIVNRRPRAIIGFGPMSNVVGALAASRVDGCRMIATQRNPSDKQSIKVGYLEKLVGTTPLYDSNIAVSEAVAASFDGYPAGYRRKLSVVHNATPALVEIDEDRGACRAGFGMPHDRLVLGCLGRLHSQKNVSFALQVLAAVPDAVLFLAGEGTEETALRLEAQTLGIAERVTFLGSLTGADITRFYRALDALLFPSIYEGFGRVLAEAMSQGVPVVASDLPIVREVGGNAVLCKPFEVPAWVEAIAAISSDPDFAGRLALLGREQSATFALPVMVDAYLAAAGLPNSHVANPSAS